MTAGARLCHPALAEMNRAVTALGVVADRVQARRRATTETTTTGAPMPQQPVRRLTEQDVQSIAAGVASQLRESPAAARARRLQEAATEAPAVPLAAMDATAFKAEAARRLSAGWADGSPAPFFADLSAS